MSVDASVPTVSVVIPCYRSEATIARVVGLTREELRGMGYATQFVLVNDCSPDGTFDEIASLCSERNDVVGVDLARNFGQHGAIMCGLRHATGDLVVLMDDDMQTHPSQLPTMADALRDEVDVVFGKYPARREALWRRLGSSFAHWTLRVMGGYPRDIEVSNFVLMRARVAKAVCHYRGPFPALQGLIFQNTSRVVNADVEHFDREQGASGYTFRSLVKLWLTSLNFSLVPLRVSSVVGALMGTVGIIVAIAIAVRKLLDPSVAVGWSSTMAALLACSGLILLSLGVVGEYVGRVFMTVNQTPQFAERQVVGGDGKATDSKQSLRADGGDVEGMVS